MGVGAGKFEGEGNDCSIDVFYEKEKIVDCVHTKYTTPNDI